MKKLSNCIYTNYPYKRMLIALQKYASTRNLNDEKWYKRWSNRVDFECFRCDEHMMKFKNCKDQEQ
jgi:hypothetical protein